MNKNLDIEKNKSITQYNMSYITRMNHILPQLNQKYKGTLFMYSNNKPSIFDELKYIKLERPETYWTEDSKWFLEDLHLRREIEFESGIFDKYMLTSGMVVGLEGYEDERGIIKVSDVIFPGYKVRGETRKPKTESYKILFISGIDIDKEHNDKIISLIISYGIKYNEIKKICIFGRIFHNDEFIVKKINEFNIFLKQFEIDIILLPSINDPASNLIPQEPFPNRFFKAENCSNPDLVKINNCNVILTSGENVFDMLKYIKPVFDENQNSYSTESILNAMDIILKCQHICPTTPDTLKSVPIIEYDKMLICDEIDFFICGNCENFNIKKVNNDRTTLISLPKFKETFEAIIFDMKDSLYEIVNFEIN
ncbi:hypothetical protein COBT_000749 [Conglomerata obtusa]